MSLEVWKSFFEIGGVFLLFLTFVFGAGVVITTNRVNKRQAKELADFRLRFEEEQQKTALAQKEAAEAKQLAGAFERDIATSNQRAAEAEQHSSEANAKAEGFRLDIAKANERAASANETAERERLARLKLEAKLAPRSLTATEQQFIASKLRWLGRQRIDVFIYPNNGEIAHIAEQVASALKADGWTIVLFQPMAGGRVEGMQVEFDQSDAAAKSRAEALTSALHDCGLTVTGPLATLPTPKSALPAYFGPNNMQVEASIRLTIGAK